MCIRDHCKYYPAQGEANIKQEVITGGWMSDTVVGCVMNALIAHAEDMPHTWSELHVMGTPAVRV